MTLVAIGLIAAACAEDETPPSAENDEAEVTQPPTSIDNPDEEAPPVSPAEPTEPPTETVEPLPFHVEGHRGARGLKPENTLPAIESALDIGVSTLELDLHLTADNQVVVWHDTNLGADKCRFADHVGPEAEFPAAGVPVASLTIDQLGDHQCDLNPDVSRFPDQDSDPTTLAGDRYQIVTLGAVFDFVATYAESPGKTDEQRARAASVEFNIETKRDVTDPAAIGDDFDGVTPGRFEIEVLAAIDAAGVADRVVIQSFDHRSLWAIRSVDPEVRLAALTSLEPPDLSGFAAAGANIWSPNFNVMSADLVEEAHDAGLLVIPWTVNERDDMVLVMERGADGLITDRPDIAALLR